MSSVLSGIFGRNFDEKKRSNLSQQFKQERKLQEQRVKYEIMDEQKPNVSTKASANDGIVNNEGQHQTYHNPYRRAPSFALYLWASLPILLIAFGGTTTIILAAVATVINFALIHIYTRPINRYFLAGFVNLVALLIFLAAQ